MSYFLKNLRESISSKLLNNKKQEPLEQPLEQPIQQPIPKPIQESIPKPIQQSLEQPIQQSLEQPIQQSLEQPIQQSIEQPIQQPYEEKIKKTNVNVLNNPNEINHLSNDSLTKEFTFDRNIGNKHVIHLCLYRINKILPIPFLEFYFEKEGSEYEFPKKVINNDIFKDIIEEITETTKLNPIKYKDNDEDDEDDEKDAEEIFLEECIIFFHENITTKENIEPIYKGFLELTGDKENIFVVFDCTDIEIVRKEIQQRWVIVEEIIEDKSIFDPLLKSHISYSITQLFKENKILSNIKNKKNKILPKPKYVYLCKEVENIYENVYFEEDEDEFETITLIPEKVNHPVLKDIYLFSKNPLKIDLLFYKIKRFIMFINEKNIINKELDDLEFIEEIEENDEEEETQDITTEELILSEEEFINEEDEKEDEDETEGEGEETEVEEEELLIPIEPVIGFREKNIEFWCTKSIKFFTQ
jgi:hypothetical protein